MTVKIDEEKCTACGTCVDTCPVAAIKIDGKAKADPDTCIDCGLCIDECPEEAISL